MNLNFLKIFFRSQRKHKVVSAINMAGLTIGILSSLFILEYVFFERSFDVTVQFVLSIVLLIGTFVTFRQASFLMKKDMGVDYNSSLVIRSPRTNENFRSTSI